MEYEITEWNGKKALYFHTSVLTIGSLNRAVAKEFLDRLDIDEDSLGIEVSHRGFGFYVSLRKLPKAVLDSA